jgi:hypothetical protein
MALYRGVLTQGGADTFTAAQILTGLTVDSKAGWQINGFKVFWSNGYLGAAQDAMANCVLSTLATVTTPNQEDEIARVTWGIQNTAGVAVAMGIEPIKQALVTEPRVTVQSDLYVHGSTVTTGLTNIFYFEISYDIIKMSELEVMRLMIGGA